MKHEHFMVCMVRATFDAQELNSAFSDNNRMQEKSGESLLLLRN
jgi:hypothetical protein